MAVRGQKLNTAQRMNLEKESEGENSLEDEGETTASEVTHRERKNDFHGSKE